MNYAENPVGAQLGHAEMMVSKAQIMDRTIGQNIAAQIAQHKAEILRLEGIAGQMRDGASMLDLRIEDLRRVMQY